MFQRVADVAHKPPLSRQRHWWPPTFDLPDIAHKRRVSRPQNKETPQRSLRRAIEKEKSFRQTAWSYLRAKSRSFFLTGRKSHPVSPAVSSPNRLLRSSPLYQPFVQPSR
ncbi:hypothetical protein Mal65_16130 [Crateriforma conspicua]|nr:hypothetical protein Mal65_16130 [Crateriforma conspicua]